MTWYHSRFGNTFLVSRYLTQYSCDLLTVSTWPNKSVYCRQKSCINCSPHPILKICLLQDLKQSFFLLLFSMEIEISNRSVVTQFPNLRLGPICATFIYCNGSILSVNHSPLFCQFQP